MARRGEEGFALLAVLGFLLVFAMFLMPFAAASRVQALTVSYEYDQARLSSVARATADYVAWRLSSDERWRQSVEDGAGVSFNCSAPRMALHIAIIPHAELISLNRAEEPLLQTGFESLDLDRSDAMSVASKVAHFRLPRPEEGEDPTGVEGGFKYAPFEDISELHDFEALRNIPLSDLSHVFSAYSGRNVQGAASVKRASDYFTIEASVFENDRWANDAAVYSTGKEPAPTRRIASIEVADKPQRRAGEQECSIVLGSAIASLLAEISK